MDKKTEHIIEDIDKAKIVFAGTAAEKDAFIAQLLRANMSMHYRQGKIEEMLDNLILFGIGIAAGMLLMYSIGLMRA